MVTPTNGYTARGLGLTLGGNTLQSIPVSDTDVISTNSHLTGKVNKFLSLKYSQTCVQRNDHP